MYIVQECKMNFASGVETLRRLPRRFTRRMHATEFAFYRFCQMHSGAKNCHMNPAR